MNAQRINAKLNAALAGMLDSPTARAFIRTGTEKPEASVMLVIDTGDGKFGSDEDRRCDGCGKVFDHLHALVVRRLRVTAYGVAEMDAAEELLQRHPYPVLCLVFGLCDACHGAVSA